MTVLTDEFVIRTATIRDAAALGIIGPAAYAETYAYLWDDPASYAAQLATFGQQAFEESLGGSGITFVAEVRGSIAGFLTMVPDSPDPIEQQVHGAEVTRIYLLKPCRGWGLGHRMLASAEQAARSIDRDYLWLDAMKSAAWAWLTYERWGFELIGEKDFEKPVIAAERRMVVLRRPLGMPVPGVMAPE